MKDCSSVVIEAFVDDLFPPTEDSFLVDGFVAPVVPVPYALTPTVLPAAAGVLVVGGVYYLLGAWAACYSPGCSVSTEYLDGIASPDTNPVEALGPHPSLEDLAQLQRQMIGRKPA